MPYVGLTRNGSRAEETRTGNEGAYTHESDETASILRDNQENDKKYMQDIKIDERG